MSVDARRRKDAAFRAAILIIGSLVALSMAYLSGRKRGYRTASPAVKAQRAAEYDLAVLRDRAAEARRNLDQARAALESGRRDAAREQLDAAAGLLDRAVGIESKSK